MTRLEFLALCGRYLIEPSLALENPAIVHALVNKDGAAVEELLKTEF